MNSDLLNILGQNSTLGAVSDLLDANETAQAHDFDTIKNLTAQNNDLKTTLLTAQQDALALRSQVKDLAAALVSVPLVALSGATFYTQLHKWPANVASSKEQLGTWIDSGGHTAQTNPGTSTIPHGTFKWAQGSDSLPARLDFFPAAPWDDIFIYERFPLPAALPTFVVDKRTFSLSASDRAAVNAIEWQQEFKWGGKVFNLGWQWNFTSKVFRIFNFTAKAWRPVDVPWLDLGAAPVSVATKHRLDAAGTTTHVSITLNGTEFPVNVTQPATPTTLGNKYTVSLCQLDSNSVGTAFGVNIHDAAAGYL